MKLQDDACPIDGYLCNRLGSNMSSYPRLKKSTAYTKRKLQWWFGNLTFANTWIDPCSSLSNQYSELLKCCVNQVPYTAMDLNHVIYKVSGSHWFTDFIESVLCGRTDSHTTLRILVNYIANSSCFNFHTRFTWNYLNSFGYKLVIDATQSPTYIKYS